MSLLRRCSRTACGRPAATTLTYVYADQTAVLGPLATYAEPHAYDLCEVHSERLSAPRGWDVVRLAHDEPQEPSVDDLLALAEAVREAGAPPLLDHPLTANGTATATTPATTPATTTGITASGPTGGHAAGPRETGRRGHLRVLRPED